MIELNPLSSTVDKQTKQRGEQSVLLEDRLFSQRRSLSSYRGEPLY